MNKSLFYKYVAKFFPKLQRYIEKVNEKRKKPLTYLHKEMLGMEFAPDNKWESTSVNTTYVAADYVAVDSELPLKSRDTVASANGKLPKVGMKKYLKESDINNLNVMIAQGGNAAKIAKRLADDAVACAVGIDEQNEYAFLFALSHGYVAIKDEDPDAPEKTVMRLNFNYLKKNKFGATVKGEVTIEDIKRVLDIARGRDQNTIIQICISKVGYDKLRQTRGARELAASYEGRSFTDDTVLGVPNSKNFNAAFEDEFGVTFRVIDRTIVREKNGKKKTVKPWATSVLVFLCNEQVGTLVYGRLAEQSNPVKWVNYKLVDVFKLISNYSKVDPLREVTSGQAFVAPILEDIDQIYMLDYEEAAEVDTEKEADDTEDEYVTYKGITYEKQGFVTALNRIAKTRYSVKTSDERVINKANELDDEQEEALIAAVEEYIVEEEETQGQD